MAKKKTKKLAISTRKTLVLSFSILAICVAMLGVSIALSYKDVLKNNFTEKKDSAEKISKEDIKKNQESSLNKNSESNIIVSKDASSKYSSVKESSANLESQKTSVSKQETVSKNDTSVVAEKKTSATTSSVSDISKNANTTSSATTKTTTTNTTTVNTTTVNTTTVTNAAKTSAKTSNELATGTSAEIASGKGERDDEPDIKPAKPGSKGTVIIIFDDAGHNLSHLQPYLEIPFPVTISVLPKLAHSGEAARRVRLAGKEVMLHQPMQAKNLNLSPGPGAIVPTDDMDEWKIKNIVLENLAEVGKVSGINNHEGSLITENAWASGLVLDVCRDKGIYFLDSRTTSESAVPIAAAERGMKIYERDIFIDNTNSHSDMLKEIEKGLKIAQRKGYVIMIGHIRPHGLAKLLTQNYKKWKNDGYEFSTISKAAGKIK